jgi:2,4-diaminopentanoate dehydrogenase
VLPFALALLQRRLDCITLEEFADVSSRNSPEMIFELMGFGQPLVELDAAAQHARAGHSPSLQLTAAALSIPIDAVTGEVEHAAARHRVEVAAGTLEAGTVGAMRMVTTGWRNGKPVLRKRALYYLTRDIEPAWELRETGWHVIVEGDTPLDVTISFPVAAEDYASYSPGLTAHPPVNAIPYVCAADPGMRTTADLPMIIGNFAT